MKEALSVTLIQSNPKWKDVPANLRTLEVEISNIDTSTDLIVLPEMFNTGFVMNPQECAETMEGKTIQWMQDIAKQHHTAIVGSLIIEENNLYFNRFVFVHSSGAYVHYDKKHLFSYAGEDKNFTAGTHRLIFEYKGWKIAPFVCYDLRFPVWSRNTEDYDIALYVANWPAERSLAWNTLIKARAIENICYVIGVNRVGTDKNKLEYHGQSQIIGPMGEEIYYEQSQKETVATKLLSRDTLLSTRKKYPFLNDSDHFQLEND
ncbi:MAG: amidohydrolase [Flavicella sp.]